MCKELINSNFLFRLEKENMKESKVITFIGGFYIFGGFFEKKSSELYNIWSAAVEKTQNGYLGSSA